MDTKVLNYRIIIEPDEETGTNKPGFTAYCPTLGIADDGDTIDEAVKNLRSLMKAHLQFLAEEGGEIPPPDNEDSFISSLKIELPSKFFASK